MSWVRPGVWESCGARKEHDAEHISWWQPGKGDQFNVERGRGSLRAFAAGRVWSTGSGLTRRTLGRRRSPHWAHGSESSGLAGPAGCGDPLSRPSRQQGAVDDGVERGVGEPRLVRARLVAASIWLVLNSRTPCGESRLARSTQRACAADRVPASSIRSSIRHGQPGTAFIYSRSLSDRLSSRNPLPQPLSQPVEPSPLCRVTVGVAVGVRRSTGTRWVPDAARATHTVPGRRSGARFTITP